MEKIINDLCEKTGIDRATAEKVANYLKENITRLPALLRGGDGESKGVLGDVVGKFGSVMGKRS
ncbi:MAG: hypothetical protein HOW73_34435 [Polyangiaceae bacterium]|nr:hypothetical protein [Polyangiaceae bacterium]